MYRHAAHFPHNQSVAGFVESFKHTKLSGALTALYSNRIMQDVAGGLIGIFFPILLYKNFDFSIYKVGIYYLISWGVWVFLVPLGAKIMSRIGMKKSLIFSVCFGWAWYYALRQFELGGGIVFLGVSLFAIIGDRMLYWIPYHTDFAEFTDKKTRGKQMSFLIAISSFVSIFIPFVSGEVISSFGYSVLFLIALAIYILSAIPLFLTPDVRENFSFGYFETFKILFNRTHRKMFLSYFADGAQNAVGALVWPIFIWLILERNYQAVGAVSSIIVLSSMILQLMVGNLSDRFSKRKVLQWGSLLNALGWIVKIFVGTGFQIFIASTYHSFANIVMRTPFDALMYEKAADSGHYVDEYTVLREIALTLGRVVMVVVILALFYFTGSFATAFFLAALAAIAIAIF